MRVITGDGADDEDGFRAELPRGTNRILVCC